MTREPAIRLEEIAKQYPGQDAPAVSGVTLDVPRGETVVLVGPSGCGKTTTLKMINRLVEPNSGRILLEGTDITTVDPNHLRRGIGYVIQQIGLFPHLDVARNIGLVPTVLGWSRTQVAQRVDELLELVGLDPGEFRSRYPKELSGGQGQRVGVARALAADPPVLLMDEPFGAIDPVTRERLQDELLWLQSQLHKTIVFVTHDIDEAVKMGDRVAVFYSGGVIAQYDTPDRVLADPADEFVASFIGRGGALKRLTLRRVADTRLADWTVARVGDNPARVRAALARSGQRRALLLDDTGRPQRWIEDNDLEGSVDPLGVVGPPATGVVGPEATLEEALNAMLASGAEVAIAVDDAGVYRGILNLEALTTAIRIGGGGSDPAKRRP